MAHFTSWILLIDSVITAFLSAALFFAPQTQRKTDGVHWHLIRCCGGQLIASSIFFYRFRNRSIETKTACFMSRVMGAALALFLFYHAKSVYPNLIHSTLMKPILYSCFGIIGAYFIVLLASGWQLGTTLYRGNRIGNFLYQLDTIASIVIGMAWISHPQWLLHKQVKITMDESHELCGQLMGVLFVASKVFSAHALYWRSQSERQLAIEARACVCLSILSAQIWSQLKYGEHWTANHWVGISLFSTWTILAVCYWLIIQFIPSVDQSEESKQAAAATKLKTR